MMFLRLPILLFFIAFVRLYAQPIPSSFSPHSVHLITGKYQERNQDLLLSGPAPIVIERYCDSEGWKLVPRSSEMGKWQLVEECDDKDRLISILVKNPKGNKVWAHAHLVYKSNEVEIETSDGQKWVLKGDPYSNLLKTVINPLQSEWHYDYTENLLTKVSGPEGRYLINEYYRLGTNAVGDLTVEIEDPEDFRIGKVKLQKSPVGYDETPIVIARYFYFQDHTLVFDALNQPTAYYFSTENFIQKIEKGKSSGDLELIPDLIEKFFYQKIDKDDSYKISSHVIESHPGNIESCQTYFYDEEGCLATETWWGNLSGQCDQKIILDEKGIPIENGIEKYQITYCYSKAENHLLLEKFEDNGLSIRYLYSQDHSLIKGKLISKFGRTAFRYFYDYNEDGIMTSFILDDGSGEDVNDLQDVTERRITRIEPSQDPSSLGKPKMIEEECVDLKNQTIQLLHSLVNTYSSNGRLIQQEIFDGNLECQQSVLYDYDSLGRLLFHQDSQGQEQIFSYDANGNVTEIFRRNTGEIIRRIFDYSNRPIVFSKFKDGDTKRSVFRYDSLGNLIKSEDENGNSTYYTHDHHHRLSQITYPDVLDERDHIVSPTVSQEYDTLGRITSYRDPSGYSTHFEYNSRGKPIRITHADLTQESFYYELDGTLSTAVDKQGIKTDYERDVLSRILKEEKTAPDGTLMSQKTSLYDSFRLASEIDPQGNRIDYSYDALGRVLSLKLETDHGKLEKKFNDPGSFNPSMQTEEKKALREGTESTIIHPLTSQTVRQSRQVDDAGVMTISTFDALGRLEHILKKNVMGNIISEQEIRYDLSSNKVIQRNTLFTSDDEKQIRMTRWEYGPENRLEKKIEYADSSQSKATTYHYHFTGKIETITKPDGVILYHEYDDKGQLFRFYSSDMSFAYEYYYDGNQRICKIEDMIEGAWNLRSYNSHNQLTSEQLSYGQTISRFYDAEGRKIKLVLPDQSYVDYTYEERFLKLISRFSSNHELLYRHSYEKPKNKKLVSSLIGSLGDVTYEWDSKGCCRWINSPYWSETCEQDHVLTSDHLGEEKISYVYNNKGQLIEEERGPSFESQKYRYDETGSRLLRNESPYTVNEFYQVTSAENVAFSYDINGNLIAKKQEGSTTFYRYDALDRLIEVMQDNAYQIRYTYDSFFRRMTQTTSHWDEKSGSWKLKEKLRFLYDEDKEIGACDENGKIIQLRVLGLGLGAEIGASVAFEFDGKVYAPIHDHRGNVMCLVNMQSRNVEESYQYSAFGVETILNSQGKSLSLSALGNPWRFASKRKDDLTGTVWFGKRSYDPLLGRWTTPDPLGAFDGPNPYVFLQNRPLFKVDLYGLFSLDLSWETLSEWYEGAVLWLQDLKKDANRYHTDTENYPFLTELEKQFVDYGHMLMGKTLFRISGYYVNPSRSGVFGQGEVYQKARITFINGILNDHDELENILQMISSSHGGTRVHYTYRGTQGWTVDMIHCIWVKLGLVSENARQLAVTWKELIQEMGGVGNGGVIVHYAHSVGGTETLLARELMSPEELQMIKVITFGSPTIVPNEGFSECINYSSRRDGVSGLTTFLPNPLAHSYFLLHGDYRLILIGSHFDGPPIIDHFFGMYWNYWLDHAAEHVEGILLT